MGFAPRSALKTEKGAGLALSSVRAMKWHLTLAAAERWGEGEDEEEEEEEEEEERPLDTKSIGERAECGAEGPFSSGP